MLKTFNNQFTDEEKIMQTITIDKTNKFEKYLKEAHQNWKEFGMNAGQGNLSYVSSVQFMNEYELKYNEFKTINPFFIGIYAISMDNKTKRITISY